MFWSGGINNAFFWILKAKFKFTAIGRLSSDFFVKVNSKILILQPTVSFNFEIFDRIPEINDTHHLACHLF